MVRETRGQPPEHPHHGRSRGPGGIARSRAGLAGADGVVVGRRDHEPRRERAALAEIVRNVLLDAAESLVGREAELPVAGFAADRGEDFLRSVRQHAVQLVAPKSPSGLHIVRRKDSGQVVILRRRGIDRPVCECEPPRRIAQSDRRGRQVRGVDAPVLPGERFHQLVLQPEHRPLVAGCDQHAPAAALDAEIAFQQRVDPHRQPEQLPVAGPFVRNRPDAAFGAPPQVVAQVSGPACVLLRGVVGRRDRIASALRGRQRRRGAARPGEEQTQRRAKDGRQPFRTRYTTAHKYCTCFYNGSESYRNPGVFRYNRCTTCRAAPA